MRLLEEANYAAENRGLDEGHPIFDAVATIIEKRFSEDEVGWSCIDFGRPHAWDKTSPSWRCTTCGKRRHAR